MIALLLNRYVIGALVALILSIGLYAKGHHDGAATASRQAEVNDLMRQLAETERDRLAAEDRATAMRAQAEQNAAALHEAEGGLDEYRKELEALASASREPNSETTQVVDLSCRAARDADVSRLRRNGRAAKQAVAPLPPKHP